METQSSPSHLNLKDVERQVRRVMNQVREGDAVAIARWYSLDPEARGGQPRKADIQYVIAREHGFTSWQSLKDLLNKEDFRGARCGCQACVRFPNRNSPASEDFKSTAL